MPGVLNVTDIKLRWHGHQLHVFAPIAVDPNLTVAEGHKTAHDVEHPSLHHAYSFPVVTVVHVNPEGMPAAHDATAHHQP